MVDLNDIRRHVECDKDTALKVIELAHEELQRGVVAPVPMDITGAPSEVHEFLRFKNEQRKALEAVRRDLYFAKVDTEFRGRDGDTEALTYLVSKHRVAGALDADGWIVVSWTSPITAQILDRAIGHVVEFQQPRRPVRRIEIKSSAKYGNILPDVEDTTYIVPSGTVYLEHERSLAPVELTKPALPAAPPEVEYEAVGEFGLTEIIELADLDQRKAMHLPFHDTLFVEGPPGSGKTSIGLMRIPCLLDRQWEELGLDPEKERPFHELSTMRVLVLNEEMIDYLSKLIRSVNVEGVPVSTFAKFCQRICRDGRTLSGRRIRNETHRLTRLKSSPLALPAYWAGFQAAVEATWSRLGDRARHVLTEIDAQAGSALADRLDRWVASVCRYDDPADAHAATISLAEVILSWRTECDRLQPEFMSVHEREEHKDNAERLRKRLRRIVRRFFSRRRIVPAMIRTDAFNSLCQAALEPDFVDEVAAEWLLQARPRTQILSDADYVIGAWLATHVSILPEGSEPSMIGTVRRQLTHVVIDEAQDVSPCHLAVVRRLLDTRGTLTLVGDLRQRITDGGHFQSWDELEVGTYAKAVFAVNHRQSRPLGEFVRALHSCLYDEPPLWKPSRRSGPLPRLRRQRGNVGLADAVAAEIRLWREQIPNATVGVLFHGRRWTGLRSLAQRVEGLLEDTLTEVHLAIGSGQAHYLTRTDCAIIASVAGTKGLEFDAAIVIDPRRVWRRSLDQISTVRRNGMYVAASRARQGLSIIVDDRSVLLTGIDESFFARVDSQGA